MTKIIITFGTFDVFHIGHLRLLKRAASLGDKLVVGVSSDHLSFKKKGRYPVFKELDRMAIVAGLACVDEVFIEESLEEKGEYITTYKADMLVMGNDWAGRFDGFKRLCDVVYLPRTENISTAEILASVRAVNL